MLDLGEHNLVSRFQVRASQVASKYVPVSRVKRDEDVAISRLFAMKTQQHRPSAAQSAEVNRLNELDRKTQERCSSFTF